MNILNEAFDVAVVGGGPAGLMAAEVALAGGARVAVFDAMPSVGRKFLLAGKGGLNLTHSEALPAFIQRYEEAAGRLSPLIEACSPQHLREFAGSFGIDTFVGSSGRVFPGDMKAAPLLRSRKPAGGRLREKPSCCGDDGRRHDRPAAHPALPRSVQRDGSWRRGP